MLAGIFYFILPEELPHVGGTRAGAIAYMDAITEHFYFGPSTLPDSALPEVPLTQTSYRDTQLPGLGGKTLESQLYVIFPPGVLTPGSYSFRFEQDVPPGPFGDGDFVTYGTVIINP